MMAKRYEQHPEVIGYDIRNEVSWVKFTSQQQETGFSVRVYD